jgi:4-hydroxyphenylacetate 3-monooxygenase
MFYAGAPFIVKTHMYRSYDFEAASKLVDAALEGYDLNGRRTSPTNVAQTEALSA